MPVVGLFPNLTTWRRRASRPRQGGGRKLAHTSSAHQTRAGLRRWPAYTGLGPACERRRVPRASLPACPVLDWLALGPGLSGQMLPDCTCPPLSLSVASPGQHQRLQARAGEFLARRGSSCRRCPVVPGRCQDQQREQQPHPATLPGLPPERRIYIPGRWAGEGLPPSLPHLGLWHRRDPHASLPRLLQHWACEARTRAPKEEAGGGGATRAEEDHEVLATVGKAAAGARRSGRCHLSIYSSCFCTPAAPLGGNGSA